MIIKEHMATKVATVSPDTPIMEARKKMKEHGVRRLPVIEDGKLMGIVTEGDIQEAGPSDATSLNVWELNYLLGQITVKEVMAEEVLTVGPDETIEKAALIMRENQVAGLPVMEEGLVGIITESDILDTIIEVVGFKEGEIRITFSIEDKPGTLIEALKPIRDQQGNIVGILSHRHPEANIDEFVVRIDAPDVNKVIQALKDNQIKVTDVR